MGDDAYQPDSAGHKGAQAGHINESQEAHRREFSSRSMMHNDFVPPRERFGASERPRV